MAESETAKGLLQNLSGLMSSIEESNKPQTANIKLHGGLRFCRFVSILLIVVGIVVVLATFALLISIMVGLPQTTNISLRIIAATPSMGGVFSGLLLLGLGVLIKVVVDSADYNAQLLRLTRRRMEKR